MIAKYPEFTSIDLSHQQEFNKITGQYDPYSDFNFTSLFSWNTDSSARAALLNENIVINLPDYITGDPVYSLLGKNQIDASLEILLRNEERLKLIPEIVVQNIKNKDKFKIVADQDNFDYIYSLSEQSALSGNRYRGKRKKVQRFGKNFGAKTEVREIKLSSKNNAIIRDVFIKWATHRNKDLRETEEAHHELLALSRLLAYSSKFNLLAILVSIDDKAVGFSINEPIGRKHAICHFQKAILSYRDIDVYFTAEVAGKLKAMGLTYTNWEQDLGLPGLKSMKESYFPKRLLKKYTIELR